jgi:hypothetical protein
MMAGVTNIDFYEVRRKKNIISKLRRLKTKKAAFSGFFVGRTGFEPVAPTLST